MKWDDCIFISHELLALIRYSYLCELDKFRLFGFIFFLPCEHWKTKEIIIYIWNMASWKQHSTESAILKVILKVTTLFWRFVVWILHIFAFPRIFLYLNCCRIPFFYMAAHAKYVVWNKITHGTYLVIQHRINQLFNQNHKRWHQIVKIVELDFTAHLDERPFSGSDFLCKPKFICIKCSYRCTVFNVTLLTVRIKYVMRETCALSSCFFSAFETSCWFEYVQPANNRALVAYIKTRNKSSELKTAMDSEKLLRALANIQHMGWMNCCMYLDKPKKNYQK